MPHVPLLVTCEPVQRQGHATLIVGCPLVLILHPGRDGCLLVKPLMQIAWGQLAVVPELLLW